MTLEGDLRTLLPETSAVSVGESVLDAHAGDLTYHVPRRPQAVVLPASREEVSRVLAYASSERVPVVPFAAASVSEYGVPATPSASAPVVIATAGSAGIPTSTE